MDTSQLGLKKTKQKQHHLRKNRTELKKPTQSSPFKSSPRDDCRCNSLAPTHPEVSWSVQVEGIPQPCSHCKPESQCVYTQQKLKECNSRHLEMGITMLASSLWTHGTTDYFSAFHWASQRGSSGLEPDIKTCVGPAVFENNKYAGGEFAFFNDLCLVTLPDKSLPLLMV